MYFALSFVLVMNQKVNDQSSRLFIVILAFLFLDQLMRETKVNFRTTVLFVVESRQVNIVLDYLFNQQKLILYWAKIKIDQMNKTRWLPLSIKCPTNSAVNDVLRINLLNSLNTWRQQFFKSFIPTVASSSFFFIPDFDDLINS